MASWKDLTRHPLSGEYRDITGPAWYRFTLKMRKVGYLADRPIILHEQQVLDGWQRLRGAIELGLEPTFATLPDGVSPEDYVEAVNDERRHETSAERAERIERIAARRKGGESTRKIADEEGVSQSQVMRDLDDANSGEPPHGSPEPAAGKVTGKDGKKYKARKEIPRCDRCKRIYPNSEKSRPGCVGCYEARRAAKKPDDEPFVQETNEAPPEVVDDDGKPVPENLLAVFRAVPMFNKLEKQFLSARKTAKEIENLTPLKKKKAIDGQKHYGEMWGPLRNARNRIIAMRPALVCVCGGGGCAECRNDGYLTQEEVDAKTDAKGIPA